MEWRLPDFLVEMQKRHPQLAVLPTSVALSCVERIKTESVQGGW